MASELEVVQPGGHVAILSADQLKAHVSVIQRAMKAVMKKDTHYGVIPGTKKPTLYKAGSEVLLTTFRIAVDPEIEDISTPDEVRYRVKAIGRHQTSSIVVGAGVGECSSSEEKYRWRAAVCAEEFDETPEDRRRVKYGWEWGEQRGEKITTRIRQVRTNPADLANTVLKMAKKRAQIDLTLTALAASDIFTQDVEDMPEHLRETVADQDSENPAPQPKAQTAAPRATGNGKGFATEKQQKLIGARLDNAGIPENDFLRAFEIDAISSMPFAKVNECLQWIGERAP